MDRTRLYQDIAERTQGDIYIGVVGPVRTGKSTFIKRFSELLMLPNMEDGYEKNRVIDELPQSGAGRSIMTTQPKFVPNEAVEVTFDEAVKARVRLVDCVGYLVPDAVGSTEEGAARMVTTPWFDHDIPFSEAATIGTQKVIKEHATIGVMVTTDGTITDLPRKNYREAEAQCMRDVLATGKPYIVIVNTTDPNGDACQETIHMFEDTYGVRPIGLDLLHLSDKTLSELMTEMLYAFPMKLIRLRVPSYMLALEPTHPLMQETLSALHDALPSVQCVRDYAKVTEALSLCDSFDAATLDELALGEGRVTIAVHPLETVFYDVLSDACDCDIHDDYALMTTIADFVHAKQAYDRLADALEKAKCTGYGVVQPDLNDMELMEPELVRQGNKFGVKLCAKASGLHVIRVDIESEVSPLVGTEQQSEALISYLNDTFANDPAAIWQTNLFGKSLYDLVMEGMQGKANGMNEQVQQRMQAAIQRIVNDGCNGLICIMI